MKNLKLLRNKHNLSQQRLADILHISQQSIYKYENDIATPDIETLTRMADYFNTSIDYLVGYTEIPHKIEPVSEAMLNNEELNLIQSYRELSPSHKEIILHVLSGYKNN